jgi:hypothetical protein
MAGVPCCEVAYIKGSLYIVLWSSRASPTGLCESVIKRPCTLMCQLVSSPSPRYGATITEGRMDRRRSRVSSSIRFRASN